MGRQYNKVIKGRRRKAYVKRKRAEVKALKAQKGPRRAKAKPDVKVDAKAETKV